MSEATGGVTIGCAARRAVLAGLASGGVIVLAGCGGEDSGDYARGNYDTSSNGAAEPTEPAPPPSSEPAPPSAPPASAAQGAGEQGGLVKTSAVPVGGGVLAGKVLVVQPQANTFKAYDAVCPHAGVTVDPPKGATITCPGHNSKFKTADGAKISGPTPRGLKAIPVKVANGWVVKA